MAKPPKTIAIKYKSGMNFPMITANTPKIIIAIELGILNIAARAAIPIKIKNRKIAIFPAK